MATFEQTCVFSENEQTREVVIRNFSTFAFPDIKKVEIYFNIIEIFCIHICVCQDDNLSFYIQQSGPQREFFPANIVCVVNVIDVNGEPRMVQSFGTEYGGKCINFTDFKWEKYINRHKLLQNSNELIPNDQLSLRLELSYTILVDNRFPDWLVCTEDIDYTSHGSQFVLQDQFFDLKTSKPESNVPKYPKEGKFSVRTVDGHSYELLFETDKRTLGHKVCDASPVFAAMLNTPMIEKENRKVELCDVHYETLMGFLTYVSDNILMTSTLEQAVKLYEMADKYEVLDLMADCRGYMMEKATVENIIDILTLANIHSDERLKSSIADFFRARWIVLINHLNVSDEKEFIDESVQLEDLYLEQKHVCTEISSEVSIASIETSNGNFAETFPENMIVEWYKDAYMLYELAQVFDLMNLKRECYSYLELNMAGDNVEELLELATIFEDQYLGTFVENFKNRNMYFPLQPKVEISYPKGKKSFHYLNKFSFKEPEISRQDKIEKEITHSTEFDFYQ